MTAVLKPPRERVRAEGGGWVALHRDEPKLASRSPAELLELARTLPGNLRHVRSGTETELLGELRSLCGSSTFEETRQRLLRWLKSMPSKDATAEDVEAALEGSGFAWARREQGWAVPAGGTVPREIALHIEPGGVRLEAVLVDWDEAEDVSRTALAAFLLAAQANLRGVRFHLDEARAVAGARAESVHLEDDLTQGLHAIATACRLAGRPAAALLLPAVARHYLACREMQTGLPR